MFMKTTCSLRMSSKTKIELFYDVVSPYSWIAFETLTRYSKKWNIELCLKPFFLGGIMQGAGNKPPGLVPNKMIYMGRDLHRLREFYSVPLSAPANPPEVLFEKGSLQAQRYLTAVDMTNPEYTENLSRQLWMRIWNKDVDITKDNSFLQAAKSAGIDDKVAQDALERMKQQGTKDRLKEYTEEALEHGAFGAPTIIVYKTGSADPHMFFGSDRFELLAHFIGEKWSGPLREMAKSKL